MNLADLIHKTLTGELRLERARTREVLALNKAGADARRMMLYAGAEPGPNRPSAAQLSTPEDYKQAWERIYLIRAARQMEEDFPFFDAILSDFETFVVGDLRYRAATGVPEADAEINSFLEWQFDQCDLTERWDLTKLARLAVRSYKRDGDCGFMVFDVGDAVKLSAISGDRIGNPTIATGFAPNDFNGVVVDLNTGAVDHYNIFRRLPKLNSYVFQQRVDPSNFIHYFDPFRIEQYHGVTIFKNAIEHGFDIKQITDFTKLNIKWRSSQLPYVKNEQGKPRGNGYETQSPALNGTPRPVSLQVDGVTQTFVKLDEGIMEYPSDFPNQQYRSVIEDLKRDCAVAAKLPLEFVYRSDAGGVVQRFYVDKAAATFAEEKRWLKRCLLNPFKNRCIQKGIKSGLLNLKKYGIDDKIVRFSGHWQMGRSISVDYGRETDADIKQMDAGVMAAEDFTLETQGRTAQEVLASNGRFVENVFKEAQRIATATGQRLDDVVPYLLKKFPNPMPPEPKAPAAGGQGASGE